VKSAIERRLEGKNNNFISGGLLYWNLLGRPEANYENPQRIVAVTAGVQTGH